LYFITIQDSADEFHRLSSKPVGVFALPCHCHLGSVTITT